MPADVPRSRLSQKRSEHQDIYAVIDLGSNSFHMLMVKVVGGSVQVIGRVKRKVRLAAGLNENLVLSRRAMKRGWNVWPFLGGPSGCRTFRTKNVRIVGTATLRLAAQRQNLFAR